MPRLLALLALALLCVVAHAQKDGNFVVETDDCTVTVTGTASLLPVLLLRVASLPHRCRGLGFVARAASR